MIQVNIQNDRYVSRVEELRLRFVDCRFVVGEENYQEGEIIFGNIDAEKLVGHKKLRWMQTVSAGVDRYLDGSFPKEATLTNATGAYSLAISEYMLSVHLSLIKKLPLYRDSQTQHDWISHGRVQSVNGSTVLVIGMGDIGGEYAKKIKALGAYVIGVRRSDLRKPDYADEIYLCEDIPSLLPRADVVAIALPGTAKTKKLIDEKSFELMKDNAILINVGRGNIVDTEALCDALIDQKIYGAALDVTDPEPLPKDSRLWDIPNALITPHVSGGFHMQETEDAIFEIFADNLKRYLSGEQLKNEVDFEQGYRKLLI